MPINPTPTSPILTIVVFPLQVLSCGFARLAWLAPFSPLLPNSWRISWREPASLLPTCSAVLGLFILGRRRLSDRTARATSDGLRLRVGGQRSATTARFRVAAGRYRMRFTGFQEFVAWGEGLLLPDRPIAGGVRINPFPITNARLKKILRPPARRSARSSPAPRVGPFVRTVAQR